MSTIKMKHSCITTLDNVTVDNYKLTSACGIASDGTYFYTIKSGSGDASPDKYPVIIYRIAKPTSTKPVLTKIIVKEGGKNAHIAKHANGLTYASKALYILTMNDANEYQIVKTGLDGKVKSKIFYLDKAGNKQRIIGLDYRGTTTDGKLKFIVMLSSCRFAIATLNGTILKATKEFSMTSLGSEWIPQDIYYRDLKLYCVYCKKDTNGLLTYNNIYELDIKTVAEGEVKKVKNIYVDNRSTTKETKKYEIEGVVLMNSVFYGIVNRESTVAGNTKDGVFKIQKK